MAENIEENLEMSRIRTEHDDDEIASTCSNASSPNRSVTHSEMKDEILSEVHSLVEVQINSLLHEVQQRLCDIGGKIENHFEEFDSRMQKFENRLKSLETDFCCVKVTLKDLKEAERGDSTHTVQNNANACNSEQIHTQRNQNAKKNSCTNVDTSTKRQCQDAEITGSSRGGNPQVRIKPQYYDGKDDLEEYLAQFQITAEINGWNGKSKALYLASSLTGNARGLLSELDEDERKDFNCLVDTLTTRFGSANRAEVFRSKLKSKIRNKGETIPELAQSVKKLTRQAYPGVNSTVLDTLALDYFIYAMTDSEIRLRLREICPVNINEAERIAVRMEAHRIADRQRNRLVGNIDSASTLEADEGQESESQIDKLCKTVDAMSKDIKNLERKSNQNRSFNNGPKSYPSHPNRDRNWVAQPGNHPGADNYRQGNQPGADNYRHGNHSGAENYRQGNQQRGDNDRNQTRENGQFKGRNRPSNPKIEPNHRQNHGSEWNGGNRWSENRNGSSLRTEARLDYQGPRQC